MRRGRTCKNHGRVSVRPRRNVQADGERGDGDDEHERQRRPPRLGRRERERCPAATSEKKQHAELRHRERAEGQRRTTGEERRCADHGNLRGTAKQGQARQEGQEAEDERCEPVKEDGPIERYRLVFPRIPVGESRARTKRSERRHEDERVVARRKPEDEHARGDPCARWAVAASGRVAGPDAVEFGAVAAPGRRPQLRTRRAPDAVASSGAFGFSHGETQRQEHEERAEDRPTRRGGFGLPGWREERGQDGDRGRRTDEPRRNTERRLRPDADAAKRTQERRRRANARGRRRDAPQRPVTSCARQPARNDASRTEEAAPERPRGGRGRKHPRKTCARPSARRRGRAREAPSEAAPAAARAAGEWGAPPDRARVARRRTCSSLGRHLVYPALPRVVPVSGAGPQLPSEREDHRGTLHRRAKTHPPLRRPARERRWQGGHPLRLGRELPKSRQGASSSTSAIAKASRRWSSTRRSSPVRASNPQGDVRAEPRASAGSGSSESAAS